MVSDNVSSFQSNNHVEKHISVTGTSFGKNVVVVQPVNIYGANISSDVFIGPFCEIQSGVVIGAGTRVQSHSFICSKVTIGQDCFIGHGVVFTNDLRPGGADRGNPAKLLPTHVGSRVSIGSGATILPVSICDDVQIGAGAVVTKDILEPGTYVGVPAKLHRKKASRNDRAVK